MTETTRVGRRAKRFLTPSKKYEIWVQLVRQEVTIAFVDTREDALRQCAQVSEDTGGRKWVAGVDAEIAYAAVDDIGDGGLCAQCRMVWRQVYYSGVGQGGSASQMLPCSRFQRRRVVTPPETRRFGADAVAVALRPTAVGAEFSQQTAMLQTGEGPDQAPMQLPRTLGGLQAMRAESGSVDTAPRRSRCESPGHARGQGPSWR